MHAPPEERIDRYVLLEEIGKGGMGVVYRAFDPRLRRQLAVKLVCGSADGRLLREAQSMAQLSHPNVVQVYDAGVVGDRVFIAMELVSGVDLGQWLRAPRSWSEVVDQFLAAGRGLAAAHAVGIVHRDFKPGNVLVADNGRTLVGDFGLARPVGVDDLHDGAVGGDARGATMTLSGPGLGTPRYMSPEQRSGVAVDARADQYSLCVALSDALVISGAPQRLRDVAYRGLAMDPAERFETLAELLDALEAARSEVEAPTPAVGSRARTWLAGAAVIAVVAAVAFVVPIDSKRAQGDRAVVSESESAAESAPAPETRDTDTRRTDTETDTETDTRRTDTETDTRKPDAELPKTDTPADAPALDSVIGGDDEVQLAGVASSDTSAIERTTAKVSSRRAVRHSARKRRRAGRTRSAAASPRSKRPEPDGLIRNLWGDK